MALSGSTHAIALANDTADLYEITRARKIDADAIVTCQRSVQETSYLFGMLYPKARAHLTTAEEFHEWRVQFVSKMIQAEDVLYFKVTLKDALEKVVGYAAWRMPGHFKDGRTLPSYSSPKATAEDTTLEPGHESQAPDQAGRKPKAPDCMDAELHKEVSSKLNEERQRIWGENADYWYLAALGVDPEYRRQGIATRLVREGLDRAANDNLPVYLEASPQGALIFPKLGFQKLGEIPLFGGRHTIQFLCRPGQSANA